MRTNRTRTGGRVRRWLDEIELSLCRLNRFEFEAPWRTPGRR